MDRDTLISLAAYGVIGTGLGLAVTMAIRIWYNRPRKPQPTLTIAIRADVGSALEALDRMAVALEQEAMRQEQALGNDVVRLWRGCYDVQAEAERIAAAFERQLETRED